MYTYKAYREGKSRRGRRRNGGKGELLRKMAAGSGGGYPKEVWSPAGGWYPDPKGWRTNTGIAFAVIAAMAVATYVITEPKTVSTSHTSVFAQSHDSV